MGLLILGETLFGEVPGSASLVVPEPTPPTLYDALTLTEVRTGGDTAGTGVQRGGATLVSYADGSPKVFVEGIGDYLQFTLLDEDGDAIDEDVFTSMTATLEDGAGASINGRAQQDVLNVNGGSWVGAGTFRMTLSPSDLVSRGPHEYQSRVLTLRGVHSEGRPWHWVFLFTLRNLRSIAS